MYSGYHIKISDIGSMRSLYNSDYFHMMPIRWMSWEAVIRVSRRQKLCLYFYNFFVGSVWVQK